MNTSEMVRANDLRVACQPQGAAQMVTCFT
jgi:hypothetical protein